jgi:NTE family protein
MAERLLLVLSGGGALGAYECGVYRALVKEFGVDAIRSMVVAGASSGALNAVIIARHSGDPDGGADALARFWRELAAPSLPFFPFPHPYWQRLNGTLTGLLYGNLTVFYGVPGGALGALIAYPFVAPYRNDPVLATLARWVGDYRSTPQQPRLLVRAVDYAAAQPVWFDSDQEPISPAVVAGSSAIPLLFAPRWHQGRPLWDGSLWPQGLLPGVLQRLRETGDDSGYHAVSVELVAPHAGLPVGIGANLMHLRDMQLGTRFDHDEAKVSASARDLRLTRIRRMPHPHEQVSSSLFDWTPQRIDALIEQGEQDAAQAFAAAPPRTDKHARIRRFHPRGA